MIQLNARRLQTCSFTASMLILLACLLVCKGAHAQGDDLFNAAKRGDLPRVEALLAQGVDVNTKFADGLTALSIASSYSHLGVVQTLLAKGADVNAKANDGMTPLHQAAFDGSKEVAQVLLSKGAEVNAKESHGYTPLHSAALMGHKDVAELLLSHKADANAKSIDHGYTPLYFAAQKDYEDVVRTLLANGAVVDAKDNIGYTPLQIAAGKGWNDIVQLLLANKADVNAKNNGGATALMMATNNSHLDVVRTLLTNGADVNATMSDGRTALMLATVADVKALLLQAASASTQTASNKPTSDETRIVSASMNVDLTGSWSLSLISTAPDRHRVKFSMDLRQEGTNVRGSSLGEGVAATISGSKIEFQKQPSFLGTGFPPLKGKILSSDKIIGDDLAPPGFEASWTWELVRAPK